jgi:hypothetical protein
MLRAVLLSSAAVLLLGVPVVAETPDQTKAFMRLKLIHTQNVLEGLATEDYALIAKSSQALVLASHESNWRVFQTPEYNQHSEDFRRIADALTKHAKEKNLDAAALDYVRLTTNCIHCHKYVRAERAKK